MKNKLLIAAIFAATCMTASAVSINWSGTGANSRLYGLTSGASMTLGAGSQTASMVMYYFDYADYDTIINLGKVDASALSSYEVARATGQTSTSASAAGRVAKSTSNTDYTTTGNSFFARAYTVFNDKTYFIDLFGGSGTGGVWTMQQSGDEAAKEVFTWSNATYGGATSDTVGTKNAWVAVPEPSTAMLALAGLALLIKRRRA